ncbi:hypothetical protein D917_10170 [Trichinella nativa]|uniref:Uncharacterized protein n=1 Tax=Trichinella nativa TaxID=6335 RepID=A0A1Y3EE15_9BILA|nr:hypothetical protein D917_10170 [Trichinella nativa]
MCGRLSLSVELHAWPDSDKRKQIQRTGMACWYVEWQTRFGS